MKKKVFISIGGGVLVLGGIFFYVMSTRISITNYPLKDGPIVAFGDSLVEGVGSTKGNDFVSLLAKKIGEPITNLGVSGDTTEQGLVRIKDVTDLNPRLVIVLLGGNDFLRKVPRQQTFDNLRGIVEKIQATGAAVILLGVRGGLFTDSADGLYEDLAHETKSAYVSNVLDGLFADSRYMSDAIHPNDVGYSKVADRVYRVVKDLLE